MGLNETRRQGVTTSPAAWRIHLLYLVLVRTEQFSEQCSRTMRGPKRLGQHSNLMQVFRQKSATRSAVRTISTVAR